MAEGRKAPALLPLHQPRCPIRFSDFDLSILEVSTAYHDVTILPYNSTNFHTFFFSTNGIIADSAAACKQDSILREISETPSFFSPR